MRAMDAPAPLDLRVNLLKSDRASAKKNLAEEQIHVSETPLSPWGLRAPSRLSVTGRPPLRMDGLKSTMRKPDHRSLCRPTTRGEDR